MVLLDWSSTDDFVLCQLANQQHHVGFAGTIGHHADAWAGPLAMAAIVKATSCSPAEVRDFLDSRHGRHFADEVANSLVVGAAISELERFLTRPTRNFFLRRGAV
jgi:hypothetical protein